LRFKFCLFEKIIRTEKQSRARMKICLVYRYEEKGKTERREEENEDI
jgi:hypothetical protein